MHNIKQLSVLYFREFKIKLFYLPLFLVISTIILPDIYYAITNKVIIVPLEIDKVTSTDRLDIFFSFCCLVNLLYWLNNFKRKLIPCVNSVFFVTIIIFWYYLLFRNTADVTLVPFFHFDSIFYTDVLVFLSLSFITKFKYYGIERGYSQSLGFVEDQFELDQLGRKRYAMDICKHLLLTENPKSAFVLAINSQWGNGKTGFLNMIEKFLNPKLMHENMSWAKDNAVDGYWFKRASDVILIKYNPWKNFDSRKLIEDFFSELSDGIKKYDNHLARNFKKYASELTKLSESDLKKLLEVSISSFYEDGSLVKTYEQINESLSRIKKQIVIFIDDLDRLTGEELIEVLKLVRNTANFRSTFFILAYDHNYVLNTIEKRSLISNKEEYLQKIVQIEINLPPISRNYLKEILFEKLGNVVKPEQRSEIEAIINDMANMSIKVLSLEPSADRHLISESDMFDYISMGDTINDNMFYRLFNNVRDVIRFTNSFKIAYQTIGDSGDIHDVIFLELLKTKFLSVFQLISNTAFLSIKNEKYEFNKNDFNNFFDKKIASALNIKTLDLPVVKEILERIFNSKRKHFFRSVIYPKYFDFYFNYQFPGVVSLTSIELAFSEGIQSVIDLIDKSVLNNTDYDLRSYLESQTDFTNREDFELVLAALFYIAKYDR